MDVVDDDITGQLLVWFRGILSPSAGIHLLISSYGMGCRVDMDRFQISFQFALYEVWS